jgi:hypothetical protein
MATQSALTRIMEGRFPREAANLDVDKDDLEWFSDVIHQKVADLLISAQTPADANGRDEYRTLGEHVDDVLL